MPDSPPIPSSGRLRILLLEDSRLDAELIQAALAAGGLEFECVRVDTRDAFLASLRRGAWRAAGSKERGQPCPRVIDPKRETGGHGCPRSSLRLFLNRPWRAGAIQRGRILIHHHC